MRYKNNPANIRYSSKNKWLGQVGCDNGFCVFSSYDYGVRALMITLKTYLHIYEYKSVKDIISRFAPASENDTRNYVAYVESVLVKHGCDPDNINFFSSSLIYLCQAICWFETHTRLDYDSILEIKHKFNLSRF